MSIPNRLLAWLTLGAATACSAAPELATASPGLPSHDLVVGADRAVARRSASGKVNWASPATVTLTNRGAFSFPWRLESSAPWLGVAGARGGQLRPGMSLEVGLLIDTATAPSERGVYLAELRVLNAFTFHQQAAVEVTWI